MAGIPTSAYRYQTPLTRHITNRRKSCRTPVRPDITAVMTKPATTGPSSSGVSVKIVSGSGHTTRKTITYVHEMAYAMTKKEIRGWRRTSRTTTSDEDSVDV